MPWPCCSSAVAGPRDRSGAAGSARWRVGGALCTDEPVKTTTKRIEQGNRRPNVAYGPWILVYDQKRRCSFARFNRAGWAARVSQILRRGEPAWQFRKERCDEIACRPLHSGRRSALLVGRGQRLAYETGRLGLPVDLAEESTDHAHTATL